MYLRSRKSKHFKKDKLASTCQQTKNECVRWFTDYSSSIWRKFGFPAAGEGTEFKFVDSPSQGYRHQHVIGIHLYTWVDKDHMVSCLEKEYDDRDQGHVSRKSR